jgi:hypothetical protein
MLVDSGQVLVNETTFAKGSHLQPSPPRQRKRKSSEAEQGSVQRNKIKITTRRIFEALKGGTCLANGLGSLGFGLAIKATGS